MPRHFGTMSGPAGAPRRRRRRVKIAIASAVLLATGTLTPLSLLGSAQADDEITGPLTDAIKRNAASVQESLAAATAARAALTANAQAFAGTVTTILGTAPTDPAGALAALQAAASAEVGSLAGLGLAQALSLSAKVAAPSCSTIGALTATLPDIGVLPPPATLFGPLAPTVDKINKGVSDALFTTYTKAFTTLLTPPTLPPGTEAAAAYVALAQLFLELLKFNWHTTYYPPGGGAPVVKDTPGFLGLPTFLDVDGRAGVDTCALSSFDLTTAKVTQSIARIPGSPATMPLDIKGQFLFGFAHAGYETKTSKAPASFNTSTTLTGTPTTTSVFKTGTTFEQVTGLEIEDFDLEIDFRLASRKPAQTYSFASSKPGGSDKGTQYNYTGTTRADSFTYTARIPSLGFNLAALNHTPAATSVEYCTATDGSCSNAPAADKAVETGSLHLLASEPVTVAQTVPAGTACPLSSNGASLTGSRLYLAHNPTRSTSTAGHVWADTDAKAASGCLRGVAGMTGTLSTGFAANDRRGQWQGNGDAPAATAKSGTIVPTPCPSSLGLALGSFAVAPYLCVVPAKTTVTPTLTGAAFRGVVLTLNRGSWPTAPNEPTFVYTWQRCGTGCTVIPGATGLTYEVLETDIGFKLKAIVKGTNLEGAQTVETALTAVVTNPPPPAIDIAPVLSGTRKVGDTMTVSDGSWLNGVQSYDYQWQRCEVDGTTGCAPIAGATANTYQLTVEDKGKALKVTVIATNFGGTTQTDSAALVIPPAPVNNTLPVIRKGPLVVTDVPVVEGERLTSLEDAGSWTYGETYTRKWLRCDELGANCAAIAGATGANYTLVGADVGRTLRVEVTATNPNDSTAVQSPATGLVLPNLVPDGPLFASAPSTGGNTYVGGQFDTIGPRVGGAGVVGITPTTAKNAALGALVNGKVVAVVGDGSSGYFLGGDFTTAKGQPCNAVAHIKSDGTLDPTYCRPNLTGEVRALAYVKGTVFYSGFSSTTANLLAVGGNFTESGRSHLVFVTPTGGTTYPSGEPNGAVNAIAQDSGVLRPNFFIGGAFTKLGTVDALGLGRVSIGSVAAAAGTAPLTSTATLGGVACTTAACTTPEVKALTIMATVVSLSSRLHVVVGGVFDTAYSGGSTVANPRGNAAAFAAPSSGNATLGTWNPRPNGPITALAGGPAANPASVYLAGDFTQVTDSANVAHSGFNGLAEYGLSSASSTTTNPNPAGVTETSSPNTAWKPAVDGGKVLAMLAADAGVYLAGSFTGVGTVSRHRLAHVTAASATAPTVNAWDPNAGQTVRAIARFGSGSSARLAAGGDFEVLGGQTRNNLAELAEDGALTSWAPVGTNGPVRALVTDDDAVYVGGTFTQAGADPRVNLAAFNRGDAATAPWNPGTDAAGTVRALARSGSVLHVGGEFAALGGAARANLGSVSTTGPGAVTAWDPQVTGPEPVVHAIAVDGGTAYVGGTFANAGGQGRDNVAAIDTTLGNATGWNPGTDGVVQALALTASTVYLGGAFGTVAGQPRSKAAAVSRSGAGAITAWNPDANAVVRTLVVSGDKILAGGDFTSIGGESRGYAAELTEDTGAATSVNPEFDARVWSISAGSAGVVYVGEFRTRGITPAGGFAFFAAL